MTQALVAQNLRIPSALGSLDAYIGAVNRVPMLTVEEERELAARYRAEEDLEAEGEGTEVTAVRFPPGVKFVQCKAGCRQTDKSK